MTFQIIKCHGSRNDFILIDERGKEQNLSDQQRSQLAQHLCDRSSTLGADGILFVQNSPGHDGRMAIFNADGSEAKMCGNGLRCVARYLSEDLKKPVLNIDTLGGSHATRKVDGFFEGVEAYAIELANIDLHTDSLPIVLRQPQLLDEELPFLMPGLRFSGLSVPNPHLVAMLNAPDENLLLETGLRSNADKGLLPEGVNVNFFSPVGNDAIFVQTFERGVGLTNACGTGMFASTLVAALLKQVPENEWVTVFNKGGFVKCRIVRDEAGRLSGELLGNATFSFGGEVDFDFGAPEKVGFVQTAVFEEEENAYQKLEADNYSAHVSFE